MIPEEIETFSREAIPILKKYGFINEKKRNNGFNKYMFLFILWIATLSLFYYAGSEDWFKSNISHNVSLSPIVENTINNSYTFSTPIENKYEYSDNVTIYNKIIISSDICEGL